MKLILTVKNEETLTILLKSGRLVVDNESLTISQKLDTLLIRSIDNMAIKNRIDRLSLKSLQIRGNTRHNAVSSMILRTVKAGLAC